MDKGVNGLPDPLENAGRVGTIRSQPGLSWEDSFVGPVNGQRGPGSKYLTNLVRDLRFGACADHTPTPRPRPLPQSDETRGKTVPTEVRPRRDLTKPG